MSLEPVLVPLALRALRVLLLALVGTWLLLCAVAFAWQRRLMYPAPPPRPPAGEVGALLRIPGPEGREVLAWYVPAREGEATLVVFHGNGEQLADQVGFGERLHAHGLGMLAVEYPGYGIAPGETTEAANYAAAEAAVRHAREVLGLADEQLVLFGRSLGTAVATELAHRGVGARLVLVSPFTSMTEMAGRQFPFLPVSLLLRDRYQTAAKAPRVQQPAVVIHGARDELIPVEMGRTVCARLPRCELVEVPGAGHNDVLELQPDALVGRIVAFARAGARNGTR
ncbi:MAG: alpha/beta hydrolase [Myxococcales bacterium]